ncbi:MAG: isoprenylcysteine carboxylmethyltransferase family protein [Acidobacteriota bacterium]
MPDSSPATASDLPGVVIFPPVLFVLCLLAALAGHWLWPLATGVPWLPRMVVAAVALASAVVLGVGGERALHGAGTNVSPRQPTTTVVTSGIYRYTRNPLYLGLLCLYTALALALDSLWPFVLWVVLLPVLSQGIVAREERYLVAKFGAAYQNYRVRVRRWI